MKSITRAQIRLCLILLILTVSSLSQSPDFQFDHITVEDGLSSNCVSYILQDSHGFMWFGTVDGLNRYDGYSFKVFYHDPDDSTSLSDNYIRNIREDSSGFIWIGTAKGLNRYNQQTEKFTRYLNSEKNPRSLSENTINVVYEDSTGTIWIGTENGLNRFNRKTDGFTRFFFEGYVDSTMFYWNNNRITALAEDHNGLLLVGTMDDFFRFNPATGETSIIPDYSPYHPEGDWWAVISTIYKDRTGLYWIGLLMDGVAVFDSRTGKSHLYANDPDNPYSFCTDASNWIYEDQTGLLWIASDEGLFIFDRKTERFTALKHSSSKEQSLSSNAISTVSGDKQGNIWIGTQNMGINKISKWKKPFRHYLHDSEDPASLTTGEVNAICEDRAGNIWTGSYGGGLSCLNQKTGFFTTYNIQLGLQFSDFKMVWGVCEDRFGSIWSCYLGINHLDPVTGSMKYYWNENLNAHSHAGTWTFTVYEDHQGTVWFGTFGAGLERFNREKETFTHFIHDSNNPQSLAANDVYAIYQGTSGFLWIGTSNGLCKMIQTNIENVHFIRYRHDPDNPLSLTGSIVYTVYEDKKNRLWVGTNGGLNLFDREKEYFSVLTDKDGLPCNDIYAILEDDHGFLWLRTKRGLVKFIPETREFRTYDERDGLTFCKSVVNGFHAFCKGKSGEMYYGGANSFAVFHPDSLRDNPDPPVIVLTGFRIYNKSVEIGQQSPLQKSITQTEVIKLSYDQNMISLDFAAIDYTAPDKNQHAYWLQGVDKDWIYCGNQHTATYTNLNPGEYLLRVKGANNDGVWNEQGIFLSIIITPPWWRTHLAYAIYLLFIIATIATTWHFQMKRIRLRNELNMKNFETQKLQEVDHLKSRFFANISHEFRTPLTLILGPVSKMLVQTRNRAERYDLQLVIRNARRLQRLINQLLDLSRLEMGKMSLQAQETDLIVFLNRIVQSFESQAKLRNIKLNLTSISSSLPAFIDREKLENILYNLLSNAFKFTPDEGKIMVSVTGRDTAPDDLIKISVADTGRGILDDKLEHIFDRFYQVDGSYTKDHEGSGIGLALTKELVELHHGIIEVTSKLGAGTEFTIFIPAGKDHLKSDEIVPTTEPIWEDTTEKDTDSIAVKQNLPDKFLPVILIVEDNSDMRSYLLDCLQTDYRVLEAGDGEVGVRQALKYIPDLIISDVMMPHMDGFTFCHKIKTDQLTSHIPVILLTARADTQSKIAGLETGADDYLVKPFMAEELLVRSKNLIEQRHKLKERFSKEIYLPLDILSNNQVDNQFIQKLMAIVDGNIAQSGFNIENLSDELGMSRMSLHRKIQGLFGQSPGNFLRTIRLKRGAELLKNKSRNISEIAYEVGFESPNTFSKNFRRQFGITPSEFSRQLH